MRQYLAATGDGYWMPQFRFEFLEYHRLIRYYQALFGAESVKVLPYELLQRRPGAFLGEIGEFVGVRIREPQVQSVNVSLSAFVLGIKRQANRYFVFDGPVNPAPALDFSGANATLERMCRTLDSILPVTVRDRHERRWRRHTTREVGTRYAQSNNLTEQLTGLDLRSFGYDCG